MYVDVELVVYDFRPFFLMCESLLIEYMRCQLGKKVQNAKLRYWIEYERVKLEMHRI